MPKQQELPGRRGRDGMMLVGELNKACIWAGALGRRNWGCRAQKPLGWVSSWHFVFQVQLVCKGSETWGKQTRAGGRSWVQPLTRQRRSRGGLGAGSNQTLMHLWMNGAHQKAKGWGDPMRMTPRTQQQLPSTFHNPVGLQDGSSQDEWIWPCSSYQLGLSRLVRSKEAGPQRGAGENITQGPARSQYPAARCTVKQPPDPDASPCPHVSHCPGPCSQNL